MSATHRCNGDEGAREPRAVHDPSAGKDILILAGMLEAAREALSRDVDEAGRLIDAALGLIRNSHARITTAESLLSAQRFHRVAKYVEINLAQSLPVEDFAAVAGISFEALNELFRRLTGDAFRAYLRGRRLQRAAYLMRSTPLKLVHIAAQCGFADQAHFTRTFRLQFGQSPRAWRVSLPTTSGSEEAFETLRGGPRSRSIDGCAG